MEPIRIIYIMGSARSGTTVLNSLLGSHPEATGLGELQRLPSSGWQRNEFCACGTRVLACAFWESVRTRWQALGGDTASPQAIAALQDEFERTRASLPLIRNRPWRRAATAYATAARLLLRAISDSTGGRWIVDSSKSPSRALALSRIEGVDVRLLHLVRDPRGVAHSLRKPYARNPSGGIQQRVRGRRVSATAVRWALLNRLAEHAAAELGPEKSCRIRYEDLAQDPVRTLAPVSDMCGVDFEPIARRVAEGMEISTGHTVAGNRVRMGGAIRMQLDTEWHVGLRNRDQRLVRLIAAPLLHRYGYLERHGSR